MSGGLPVPESLPSACDLVRTRVVEDPGTGLAACLDRGLTGYAVFTPGDALLLGDRGRGVLTVRGGVPTHAYHTGSGRAGAAALDDLAAPGPFEVALYAIPASASGSRSESGSTSEAGSPAPRGDPVDPDLPAERLTGDTDLAARTRAAAPADLRPAADDSLDAVEAFLENEEKVAAIRERAREEAQRRAAEWGFEDLGE
jgi:hypothetical protein